MPKPITTFLGPAVILTERYATTKARIALVFPEAPRGGAPNGPQTLRARRHTSAREPNTWIWTLEGIRGLAPEQVIAPTSRDAVREYLAS